MRSSPKVVGSVLIGLAAIVAAFFNPVFTIVFLAVVLAIFFLARNLGFGLLILVFFFPYLGLIIDFGEFEVFREVWYLKDINAPFIDLYGLLLFIAWVFRSLATHNPLRSTFYVLRSIPHRRSYLLFWLSGLISLLRVPSIYWGTALKYLARPFTFFYLVFFVVPISILTQSTSYVLRSTFLHKVLTVFYFTGLLSALNGLIGLFFGAHEGLPRATPLGFFGVNPLGPNHNLLAETLIATAPAGLILRRVYEFTSLRNYEYSHTRTLANSQTRWILYGSMFQWGIALLTFARTAWIAVAVQAIVYFYFEFTSLRVYEITSTRKFANSQIRKLMRLKILVPILLIMLLTMLSLMTLSETVRGSTLSRLDQARIAAFYFERAPIFGQGIGTFVPTLWQTKAYLLEYGEPLEAHGIIFKLMFEQGLLGILAFSIFVGAILFRIKKSGNVPALLIAVGSITYQLFNTTYYTSKLWIPLAIAVAIVQSSKSGKSSEAGR